MNPDQHLSVVLGAALPRRRLLRLLGVGALSTTALSLAAACSPAGAGAPTASPTTRPPGAASPAAKSSPASGQTFAVNMTDTLKFEPGTLTVPRGATVTWRNGGQVPHTATDDPAKVQNKANAVLPGGAQPWDSGTITAGQSWSHTFTTPGEYTYFCVPHEAAGMVGKVIVTA